MCMCMYVHVHTCMEASDQSQVSILMLHPSWFFLRQGLSLAQNSSSRLVLLASSLGIHLFLPPQIISSYKFLAQICPPNIPAYVSGFIIFSEI